MRMFLMLVLSASSCLAQETPTGPAATGDRAAANKLPLIRWRKPLPFPPERACNWRWQTPLRDKRLPAAGDTVTQAVTTFPVHGRQGFGGIPLGRYVEGSIV